MKRIPRRIFTEEFKREAIKLVTEQGLTLAEAAQKLDIATKSLRTWINQQSQGSLFRSWQSVLQCSLPCVASKLWHDDFDES